MFGLDSGTVIFLFIVVLAVIFLKGFDQIAGRGPKQIRDGLNKSQVERVPCPHCAENILPAARKCPFCRSELS